MTLISSPQDAGRTLAERLGIQIIGTENHDLKCACVSCKSSDAGRIHRDSGAYYCYSCSKALSPFDLCKVVLADHEAAKKLMVEVGLYEDHSTTHTGNGEPIADPILTIARLKNVPPDGLRAYDPRPKGKGVVFPMYGPDGIECSGYLLSPTNGKGIYAKGQPTGLFLPGGRMPKPGEEWCIAEGVKDAAALTSLGFLAVGLPGNALNAKFAGMFKGVHVLQIPDADMAGRTGAQKTTKVLHGLAKSVKLVTLPCPFKETGGDDVRDVLKREGGRDELLRAIQEAESIGADGQPAKPITFTKLIPSSELLTLDLHPRFLIRGVLAAEQHTVFGGRTKTLKTSIAIDAGVSLATGTPFLGYFHAEKANVAFWSGESGAVVIRETAIRIAKAKGVQLPDSIFWGFSLPKLSQADHLDALRGVIDERKLEVVFVDPLYLSLLTADSTGNPGNLFFMGSILEPLTEISQTTGITFVVLHHFRKNRPVENDEIAVLEELTQSGIAEWSRSWVLLERKSPYNSDGKHKLWMRTGGSLGHSGFWSVDIDEGILDLDSFSGRKWEVTVNSVANAKAELQHEKERKKASELEHREGEHVDRIKKALEKFPDGETAKQLRVISRLNADNFDRAIYTLQTDGRVEPCEVIKPRGKYDGYRLKKG